MSVVYDVFSYECVCWCVFSLLALTCVWVAGNPGGFRAVALLLLPVVVRTLIQREFVTCTLHLAKQDGSKSPT